MTQGMKNSFPSVLEEEEKYQTKTKVSNIIISRGAISWQGKSNADKTVIQ